MVFHLKQDVDTASDSVLRNGDKICARGKNCLIVTGRSSAKKSGALDDLISVFQSKGLSYCIYDKISANPSVVSCIDAGRFGAVNGADFVVGIGGGSALDAAKAAAIFLTNPSLDESGYYGCVWQAKPAPVILIGTTAGTGSEVTPVAVLTDSAGKKHSLHHDCLYADFALGDAKYTVSLPQSITLSTGIDALTHCIESYFSKKANPVSRAFAVAGIQTLVPPLMVAARPEFNLKLEDRQNLYDGSILGGLAISITGTVFPHSVGYYLTEKYGVPHGAACAHYTLDLLSHIKRNMPEYYDSFYQSITLGEDEFIALIKKARPLVNVKLTSDEVDATLPRFNNNSVKNTIADISLEEIREILLG